MMPDLNIAIVGHTNTGKTSLIRSLSNDRNFGAVADAPSTTTNVERLTLSNGTMTFHFYDTPGIEDAMGIIDQLEESPLSDPKHAPNRLQAFIDNPANQTLYEQEIKVLRAVLQADLILYVVDIRLPYLPKFSDEIHLILQAHKPLLPLFNFLTQGRYLQEWQEAFKVFGIHHILEFDTIVPPRKRRFYEQIAIMFPNYYEAIQNFIQQHERAQQQLHEEALTQLANFYLNLLSTQVRLPKSSSDEVILTTLQKVVSTTEEATLQALLTLYRFNREDVALLSLNIETMRADNQLFTSERLIDFSMQFGKGATIGAGLFAGADLLAGFTTLGAATATGALIGGVTSSMRHYGSKLWDKLNDIELYSINDEALHLLTTRMLTLVELLNGRSHADVQPILLESPSKVDPKQHSIAQLIQETRRYRAYDHYAQFGERYRPSKERDSALEEITGKLKEIVAILPPI